MHKHYEIIKVLIDEIEQDVSCEINILDKAMSSGLSPWHFQRLFKGLIGDTLGGYLRGRRLTKAAHLLKETDMRIIDIALEVGFSSHESFTRAFKSQLNYSPNNFRKNSPEVNLNNKPVLTDELFDHIQEGISKEPEILELQEVELIGHTIEIPSPFTTDENICEIISTPWLKLMETMSNVKTPLSYYGLTISPSGSFTENNLTYLAAVPKKYIPKVEGQMMSLTLPKQQVASFDTFTNIEADIAKKTIDYIYGYWLPNSNYKRGEGHDFEYFENVTDFRVPDFSSKYIIPIE